MKPLLPLLLLLFAVQVVRADVTDAAPGGFTVVNSTIIKASRADVWRAATIEVGAWWSSDHTVAGDASRLSLDATPNGCFCESFGEGAGVVHMTVSWVSPGVILRLTGGLGPLGLQGVAGNMTWEFNTSDAGTEVTFTYVVGGYMQGGLDAVAAPVDNVVDDALQRLKAHVESKLEEPTVVE